MKYESPIDIITRGIELDFDNKILKAIQSYGIVVEKDELIKALEYDRHQYEKGYADAMAERKTGKWIDGSVPTYAVCSVCAYQERFAYEHNYCPNCGADMRGDKDG